MDNETLDALEAAVEKIPEMRHIEGLATDEARAFVLLCNHATELIEAASLLSLMLMHYDSEHGCACIPPAYMWNDARKILSEENHDNT